MSEMIITHETWGDKVVDGPGFSFWRGAGAYYYRSDGWREKKPCWKRVNISSELWIYKNHVNINGYWNDERLRLHVVKAGEVPSCDQVIIIEELVKP